VSADYDVVTVGDFRFPGGTSAAIEAELRAQAAAGYRTGLVQLKGPTLRFPHPIHPGIRACLDEGLADLLDPDVPVSARLLLAHHPFNFAHPASQGLGIAAEQRLLVVHQPPFDGAGEPFYDCAAVARNAEELLGGAVTWAPVGPRVREQLGLLDEPLPLTRRDWHNILDAEPWRVPRDAALAARPVIGRHSRPDPLKWPDDRERILEVYPDDPRYLVRILGGGAFLRELVGVYPRNWQVLAFNEITPQRFLATIDFFVYYHHSRWVEAFGRTVLEAMASGALCILPPGFRNLFENGAVYAEPAEVRELVRRLHVNRRAFREQSLRGTALVRARFGPASHVERLRELIGRPHPPPVPLMPPSRRRRRVLFMTSDGVGMGHLTRMLAVARRCPAPLEPVFVTLSQALRVVREHGFLVEYLPFHSAVGCDNGRWNRALREELDELIAFYDPAVLVFDGNVPYQGLLDALRDNPGLWSVWCRRGMWQAGHGAESIRREGHFDAVVEPHDLAASWDRGLTVHNRSRTRAVDPIRLLDADELLEREAARAALGLDTSGPAVLLQLGAGNNYDYAALERTAITLLQRRHAAQVAVARWPIAERPPPLPEGVRELDTYPLSRHLKAFELVISAVGYNSFHELLLAGVPAILVPNEHPQQDDQLARARFAERHGLAACVRTREVYKLGPCIERLLDPGERQQIAHRCAALDHTNGALEFARLIEEMAYSRRVDRP
jgi:hypothetical protein